jgi:type IV secretory pathway VirB2 component (pilin)
MVTGVANSSSGQQRAATAGLLAQPAGRWLVALAGVAVVALGIGLFWYGVKRKFERQLRLQQASMSTRQTVTRLGQVGYIAKGCAFTIAGVLLILAAVHKNAAQSTGLDGALRTLAAQPFGTLLLIVVAVGIAAFGVYCFFQAKYRKV